MRKLLLFIVPFFLFSCRPSPQEKAENLIRTYLNRTLAFPQNYQPISFSPLDSAYTAYKETKEHQFLKEKMDNLQVIHFHFLNTAILSGKKRPAINEDQYYKEIKRLTYQDSLKEATYKSQFGGWTLIHEFRGKQQDSLIKVSCKFSFDKKIDHLTKIEWTK